MSALATRPASSRAELGTGDPTAPAAGPADAEIDRGWWYGGLAVAVAELWWATRRLALFQDDFVFLGQARSAGLINGEFVTQNLTGEYLGRPLFEHFSPLTRLLFFVTSRVGEPETTAHILLMVLLAGCVVGIAAMTRAVAGRTAPALLVVLIATQALVLTRLGGWVTASFNILPATALGAVSIAGAVRYLRHGRVRDAVVAVVCFALGCLDYELAMMVPLIGGLWYLLGGEWALGRRTGTSLVRHLVADVWGRRWLWIGYAVVALAALVNYRTNYYLDTLERATPGDAAQSVGYSLLQGLLPALLGVFHPVAGEYGWQIVATSVVWLLAIVAAVVAARRRGAAMVAVAAVAWLVPTALLAVNRAAMNGPSIATELYYATFGLLGVALAAADILANRRRTGPRVTWSSWPVVGLAAATVLTAVTLQVQSDKVSGISGIARRAGTLTDAALADISSLRPNGERPAVISTPSTGIVSSAFYPYNWTSFNIGLLTDDVRWNANAVPLYRVGDEGRLVDVTLAPLADLPALSTATASGSVVPAARGCVEFVNPSGRVELRFAAPAAAPRLAVTLRGTVSQPSGAVLSAVLADGTLRYYGAIQPELDADGFDLVLATDLTELGGVAIGGLRAGTTLCLEAGGAVGIVDG